ncbi:MAG: hypothetical protein F4Y54_04040 [Dehalococcoidia bacterium]|nr:hypothetical protein [Dehalococcoidia bacterium]
MSPREALLELVLLLRQSTADQRDPVLAAGLMREAQRLVHKVEDQDAREAEIAREVHKELRTGLRSLEFDTTQMVSEERERATETLDAKARLEELIAASGGQS